MAPKLAQPQPPTQAPQTGSTSTSDTPCLPRQTIPPEADELPGEHERARYNGYIAELSKYNHIPSRMGFLQHMADIMR